MLTKSLYLSGLQCLRNQWREANGLRGELSKTDLRSIRMGNEVGALARQHLGDGVLIDTLDEDSAVAQTRQAMESDADIIFEGAFRAGDCLVRCDVLLREGDGWHLVEVKATTDVDEETHHDDAGFQLHVLRACGVTVTCVCIMHINSADCVAPNLSNLFTTANITAEATLAAELAASRAPRHLANIKATEPVHQPIGPHCKKPQDCAHRELCWSHIPAKNSVFSIPNIRAKGWTLYESGVLMAADVPDDIKMSENMRRYVSACQDGQPRIDHAAIRAWLDAMVFPLHFFDFETVNHPIPPFDGMVPWAQLAFQYSLHILHADGRLEHFEYLHNDDGDPRPPLLDAMRRHFLPTGSVMAYNQSFEASRLKEMAKHYWHADGTGAGGSSVSRLCLDLVDRLVDLWDIFRGPYLDHRFNGRTSIKYVLPVLVPSLSYATLDVQKGDQAQVAYEEMLKHAPGSPQREALRLGLLAYCEQDTLAMVEIYRKLMELPCQI